jgi:UDP-N-acetylmuramoylalanine--D-glutamate ligase
MTIDARHPLPGTRPLVVGAARSGQAAARLLKNHGLDVVVCDRRSAAEAGEAEAELAALGVTRLWGRDDPVLLTGRDFVVWSPGIPIDHPLVGAARAAAIPVISELELGFFAAAAPLLCITGTNGKSTTTDLVGALLRAAGREVGVCGNIGRAICDVAPTIGPQGLLVVEVSSYQLETVDRLKPFVATWLNLTPDHLERHGTFEEYGRTKQRLFERQDENDWSVRNADDPAVMAFPTGAAQPLTFSIEKPVDEGVFVREQALWIAWRGGVERLLPLASLTLRGRHNHANAAAAVATVLPLEIAPSVLRGVLESYPGLEHRMEPAGVVDGVEFINDSKATNLDSLTVALASYTTPVVLIAGGRDKGQDFQPLAETVRRMTSSVILIGEGADRIAAAWAGARIERAGSLAEAVEQALERARQNGNGHGNGPRTVLFSPGCSSFDMFQDFEDRGRRFKAEVRRLQGREART